MQRHLPLVKVQRFGEVSLSTACVQKVKPLRMYNLNPREGGGSKGTPESVSENLWTFTLCKHGVYIKNLFLFFTGRFGPLTHTQYQTSFWWLLLCYRGREVDEVSRGPRGLSTGKSPGIDYTVTVDHSDLPWCPFKNFVCLGIFFHFGFDSGTYCRDFESLSCLLRSKGKTVYKGTSI